MAHQRCVDFLANQIVVQQDVDTGQAIVEDVDVVFAIGRRNAALEQHVLQLVVECLVFTRLQIESVGEDQAVVVRQQDAGILQRVHADRLLKLVVVDEV